MSIPLDRLYYYIEDVAKEVYSDVIIYRFWPHGSKKIENLLPLREIDWLETTTSLLVYCNDQEPLHWELYNDPMCNDSQWTALLIENSVDPYSPRFNNFCRSNTFYDKSVVLHSEKRSSQCEKYQQSNFVLAYYWSHAVIARDWFRFAQHVHQKKSVDKMFLIYNRAWSGTREYRLKFFEQLIHAQLQNYCKTTVSIVEPEIKQHYGQYQFKNCVWQPNVEIENYFPLNSVNSHYSADFDLNDYEHTNIEVVLETLFDDNRLHLTEKTLRPIACKQPFILAATVGSLEYLQSYGFKTFKHIWSEEYDLIEDPMERLNCIVKLMSEIANWDTTTRQIKLAQAQEVASYNKQHFFSKEFFNLIDNELRKNLSSALIEVKKNNTAQTWLNRRRELSRVDQIQKIISGVAPHPDSKNNPTYFLSHTKENIEKVVAIAKKIAKSKE